MRALRTGWPEASGPRLERRRSRRSGLAFAFGLALALDILPVRALVGLDVLELSLLVTHGIKLRSLLAAMRRPFGRHDPLPWLMAVWHRSRFYEPRQSRRKAHLPTPRAPRLGRVRLPSRSLPLAMLVAFDFASDFLSSGLSSGASSDPASD